jgi:hypothetical protein
MPDDDETDGGRRGVLIAAGVIVLLVVVGLVLTRFLWASAKLQDCMLSGRTNCAPIERPQ